MSETKAQPQGAVEQAIDDATAAVRVQSERLPDLDRGAISGDPLGLPHLLSVPVQITVEVGRTRMLLSDLVKLAPGSLIELDREAHEPADILVNGAIVARGEVVTIDEYYGVRITRVNQG
jgi:flagellar motor switch protein FliN/FliY